MSQSADDHGAQWVRIAGRGCEFVPRSIRAGARAGQSEGKAICRGSEETRHVRRSAVLLQGGV